jgi:hypothetical protein
MGHQHCYSRPTDCGQYGSPSYYQPDVPSSCVTEAWGPARTIAVDGQGKDAYDRMIKDRFTFTQDNMYDAHQEAAKRGLPVVAIFGSWEHNNSRSLIQNALPYADQRGDKAVYVYIDPAKCPPGKLADFANAQFAGGHNAAISLVYTLKPGADGKPEPEPCVFRWQGSHPSMIPSFNQALSEAQRKMDSYKGKFSLDAPVAPPPPAVKPEAPPAPADKLKQPELEKDKAKEQQGEIGAPKPSAKEQQLEETNKKLKEDAADMKKQLDELRKQVIEMRQKQADDIRKQIEEQKKQAANPTPPNKPEVLDQQPHGKPGQDGQGASGMPDKKDKKDDGFDFKSFLVGGGAGAGAAWLAKLLADRWRRKPGEEGKTEPDEKTGDRSLVKPDEKLEPRELADKRALGLKDDATGAQMREELRKGITDDIRKALKMKPDATEEEIRARIEADNGAALREALGMPKDATDREVIQKLVNDHLARRSGQADVGPKQLGGPKEEPKANEGPKQLDRPKADPKDLGPKQLDAPKADPKDLGPKQPDAPKADPKDLGPKQPDAPKADPKDTTKATTDAPIAPVTPSTTESALKIGLAAAVGDKTYSVVGHDGADVIVKVNPVEAKNPYFHKLDESKVREFQIPGQEGKFYRIEGSDNVYRKRTLDRTLTGGDGGEARYTIVHDFKVKTPTTQVYKELAKAASAETAKKQTADTDDKAKKPTDIDDKTKKQPDTADTTKRSTDIPKPTADIKIPPISKDVLATAGDLQSAVGQAMPKINDALAAKNPKLATSLLQQAVSEYLTANELATPAQDRLTFGFGDKAGVEHYIPSTGGKPPVMVTINGEGKFVNPQTSEIVAPENVHTRIILSAADAAASGGKALTKQVVESVLVQSVPDAERAGIDRAAVAKLAEAKLGEAPKTEVASAKETKGLHSTAPVEQLAKEVPAFEITATGVRIGDKSKETVFDQMRKKWSEEVDRDRKALELARSKATDERELARLDGELKDLSKEEAILHRLETHDRTSAEYIAAVAEAEKFVKEGVEKTAKEGTGGHETIGDRASRARNVFVWLGLVLKAAL